MTMPAVKRCRPSRFPPLICSDLVAGSFGIRFLSKVSDPPRGGGGVGRWVRPDPPGFSGSQKQAPGGGGCPQLPGYKLDPVCWPEFGCSTWSGFSACLPSFAPTRTLTTQTSLLSRAEWRGTKFDENAKYLRDQNSPNHDPIPPLQAAEVLEAQLLCCLTGGVHQVILIGDHLQLQPSVAQGPSLRPILLPPVTGTRNGRSKKLVARHTTPI